MFPLASVRVGGVEQTEHDGVHDEPALALECRVVLRMVSLQVAVDEVAEGLARDGHFDVDDADLVRAAVSGKRPREECAERRAGGGRFADGGGLSGTCSWDEGGSLFYLRRRCRGWRRRVGHRRISEAGARIEWHMRGGRRCRIYRTHSGIAGSGAGQGQRCYDVNVPDKWGIITVRLPSLPSREAVVALPQPRPHFRGQSPSAATAHDRSMLSTICATC